MKYFFILITTTIFIFAGGDFFPVELTTKFEKMDRDACDCGTPAQLLPYNGEDIPMAETEPCLDDGCQMPRHIVERR